MEKDIGPRPRPFLALLLLVPGAFLVGEVAVRSNVQRLPRGLGRLGRAVVDLYLPVRAFVVANWPWLTPVALVALIALVLAVRQLVIFWHNSVVARIADTRLTKTVHGFPRQSFDIMRAIEQTPAGRYFVGLDPAKRPVYLTEWDLDTHGHIMGHTGSGKTRSVLEPLMLQDLRRGKGLLFMDAKGSSENVSTLRSLAALTGRSAALRVFALAHPDWSHTYNPVYLGRNGDPLAAAERVFSVFRMDNEYYRGQAKLFFYSLLRLLAGTGKAFNLVDLRLCVGDEDVLDHVFGLSDDRVAKYEISNQLRQLGRKRLETFTGLHNALAEYDHPLLNAYAPDIVIDDMMNERGVVYFNLPANRYALLAPAIGQIVLQHVKAVGALRQIDRERYDQTPFSVNIDELNRFAFPELVPSLAMLRDAHVQFRLSHQSLGDLEQVSPVFAQQVRDNTRWKVFLFENDPEHLELVARSYGTRTAFKKTVRFSLGPLLTFLNTGEVSNREVEEFVVHPNALKSLAPQGQGYLMLPDRLTGLSFATLPRLPRAPDVTAAPRKGDGLDLHGLFVASAQTDKLVLPRDRQRSRDQTPSR